MQNETEQDWAVTVDRQELLEAINTITSFKRRPRDGRLKLTLVDGELHLSMPNVDVSLQAYGKWEGAVWISATVIWALDQVPPKDDPVSILLKGDRVQIGSTFAAITKVSK